MPTPPKPANVIEMEKKSHRTKAELKQRKEAEKELLSGVMLRERPEVKNDKVAHKEFLRIEKLLMKMDKNDALYEPIINRYCLLQAECLDLEQKREETYELVSELKKVFYETTKEMNSAAKADYLLNFSKQMASMLATMVNLDKMIQMKRRMILDIEKENIMTIASALRSVPKNTGKGKNELLEVLGR